MQRFTGQLDELLRSTGPWLIVGLLLAAIVEPVLAHTPLLGWPDALQVLCFAVIGVPVYVCASGATPIVAVLLAGGLSPGAGLAFLLAGPATNVASFGLLASLHDLATARRFAVGMLGGAVLLGWLTNVALGGSSGFQAPPLPHEHAGWIRWSCLALLTTLLGLAMLNHGARRFFSEGLRGEHSAHAH